MYHFPLFSGSYPPEDVQFLLKPAAGGAVPQLLREEPVPDAMHSGLFEQALKNGAPRLAKDALRLAATLKARYGQRPVVLVSLIRSGVPAGVILNQTLREAGCLSYHYAIGMVRGRGIDLIALDWIEQHHGTDGIVFVDGWTGKGAIAAELKTTLSGRPGYPQGPRLVTLSDPCGHAWLSATDEDWPIPSGFMGASASGLVSRPIWSETEPYTYFFCDHLAMHDYSRRLTDTIAQHRREQAGSTAPIVPQDPQHTAMLQMKSSMVLSALAMRYRVSDINRIKPGIAEATRAVLRTTPEHVFVRSLSDPDTAPLVYLAQQKNITVTEAGNAPGQYKAIAILRQ